MIERPEWAYGLRYDTSDDGTAIRTFCGPVMNPIPDIELRVTQCVTTRNGLTVWDPPTVVMTLGTERVSCDGASFVLVNRDIVRVRTQLESIPYAPTGLR